MSAPTTRSGALRGKARRIIAIAPLAAGMPWRAVPLRTSKYVVPTAEIRRTIWRSTLADHLGVVPPSGLAGGDWDTETSRFEATPFYRSLVQRYVEGRPWDETPMVRLLQRGGFARRASEHGSERDYLAFVDDLFESMSRDGYHPLDHEGRPNTIGVALDRDGAFIRYGGSHRLAVAKIVGVEEIPVRVELRHTTWQRRRIEFVHEARKHPDRLLDPSLHPDLRAMFPDPARGA